MIRILIIAFSSALALLVSWLIANTNTWLSNALLGVSASFIVVWVNDFIQLYDQIKAIRINVKLLMAALCAEMYTLYCSLDEMRQDGHVVTYDAIGTALGTCRSTLNQICSTVFPTGIVGHKVYIEHAEIRNLLIGKINDDFIRFSLLESAIIEDKICLVKEGKNEIVTYQCPKTQHAIDMIINLLSEDYQFLIDKEGALCALHSGEFDWPSIKGLIETSRKSRNVSL